MAREGSLWIGGLESYMDENFIRNAFSLMGEVCNSVKLIRNRYTSELVGYGFVNFSSDQAALSIMHKLNGKIIPCSQPPIRFKLNHASLSGNPPAEREFSIWVGDLSPDVSDNHLYRAFATRYQSIRAARVIHDNTGFSKGYGFIRFANEEEQKDALSHMNGFQGLGMKPIKVSFATPRTQDRYSRNETKNADYSQYYEQYWQNYAAWQNYGNYYDSASYHQGSGQEVGVSDGYWAGEPVEEEDEFELVEHDVPVDVERMNRDLMERNEDFWDALESSRWLPVETIEEQLVAAK